MKGLKSADTTWRPGFYMFFVKGGLRAPFISSRVDHLVQRGPPTPFAVYMKGLKSVYTTWRPDFYMFFIKWGLRAPSFHQGWATWFKGAHSLCCLHKGPEICLYNLEARLLHFLSKGGWGPLHVIKGGPSSSKKAPLPLLFKWSA